MKSSITFKLHFVNENALIIFVRNPEKGNVKTRIAAAAGEEAALAIYLKLLQHTQSITQPLCLDKYVYYANYIVENDLWSLSEYRKKQQGEGELGSRMQQAFRQLLTVHKKVGIIGSDCYELTTELINEAFILLDNFDVVLGPARDGGYYFLGMKDSLKEVFFNIHWSTDKVLQQTIHLIRQQGLSYKLLSELSDVDTIADVPKEWIGNR